MRKLLVLIAFAVSLPGGAQNRDYRMTAEIAPLAAEPWASTGGNYSLVGGVFALPPDPGDRIFTDSFE